jgi:hypothetical protein
LTATATTPEGEMKESKFFEKQAVKALASAQSTADPELAKDLNSLSLAYRAQAHLLKKSKKTKKEK